MTDVPTQKRTVRRARRALRRELVAARDVEGDARALADHGRAFLRRRGLSAGATTTLYESWAGEPPTEGLLAALLEDGIRVLLPITLPDLDLDWFDAADPDRTPLGHDAVFDVDLALVPGLAVDSTGTRLGQGGGCYDKAIPRTRPGTEVVVLLHPGEVVACDEPPLPRDHHDVSVDGVLTAEGHRPLT